MNRIIKNTAVILLTAVCVYYCLVTPETVGEAVKNSVDRCLYVIVPSMFIFMCITCFISNSGMHIILSVPFKFVAEKLFRIPKEGFAVFLLSMISGYPAGIKLVNDNFSKGIITKKQSEVMNCYCCCAGPAFITGTAGNYLYPDSNAGMLLFISVLTGNLITALIMSQTLPKLNNTNCSKFKFKQNCFIPSVKSAGSAMLQMCIMIAAFGGLAAILKLSGFIDVISYYTSGIFNLPQSTTDSIILSLFEISNIVTLPTMQLYIFPVAAFLISFGGICVHMQIAAIADSNFSLKKFFIARIFSASVSAITAVFLMRFLNVDISCNITYKVVTDSSYSPLPSLFLLIMITMLLSVLGNKKAKP